MSENKKHSDIFFVKSTTGCKKLADSFYARFKDTSPEELTVQGVGASAVNQAVKAVIILNKKLIQSGEVQIAHIIPRFIQSKNGDQEVNVVEFSLKFFKIY